MSGSTASYSDMSAREAEFHDDRFESDARARASKFYRADRSFQECYWEEIDGLADVGGRLLEFGCGPSAAVLRPSLERLDRIAIDISSVAVRLSAESGSSARFQVMDCHALGFLDSSQSGVCGSGILHHLDLDVALPEISRVLRAGGRGVFLEPLGHNPVINLYRRLTPTMRTVDEHPLLAADLRALSNYFERVEIEYFSLIAPVAALFRRLPGSSTLERVLQAIDRSLLKVRPLRRYAWMVVIRVAGHDRSAEGDGSRRAGHGGEAAGARG